MKNYYYKHVKSILFFTPIFWSFLFTFFAIWFNFNTGNNKIYNLHIFAYEQTSRTYAKVNNNCGLYSSANEQNNSLLFYVPESYFVSIISSTENGKYFVSYGLFSGYVDESNIDIVSFVPNSPTLENITFDILNSAGTQIWDKPNTNTGKILSTISADTKKIKYIASTLGEIPIGGKTNVWYYCEWTPPVDATKVYQGYVYREATTNLSHIILNPECEPEKIINSQSSNSIKLSDAMQTTMIILICLPFAILLIFAISKIVAEAIKNKKSKVENKLPDETISHTMGQVPKLAHKSFKRKRDTDGESIEVVFPEYNYIDDDDLM